MAAEYGDCPVLCELTPVLLSDNTEVKVPISTRTTVDNESTSSPASSTVRFSVTDLPQQNEHVTQFNHGDVVQYNKLIDHFHELPGDMFITQILSDSNSCEQTLENMRGLLYESLKDREGFPFPVQCELKRRLFTRKGDPVSLKLAQDICDIITVIEGENFSVLKDMISTGTSRRKSISVSQQQTSQQQTATVCNCSQELALIKDTIASLRSEMLLMKQKQVASEKLHTENNQKLSASLIRTKDEISSNLQLARNDINTVRNCVNEMSSRVGNDVTETKQTLDSLSLRLNTIESFLDTSGVVNVSKLIPFNNEPYTGVAPEILPPVQPEPINIQPAVFEPSDSFGNATTPVTVPCNTETIIENIEGFLTGRAPVQSVSCQTNTQTVSHVETQTDATQNSNVCGCKPSDSASGKKITFAEIYKTLGYPFCEQKGNNIPVHVSHNSEEDFDDFQTFLRKRTKRFFIGGFKAGVTEKTLLFYVGKKGPKVTMIRIFPCKRNSKYVIIRLNVEANGDCDKLVNPGFWPPEVTCKPWKSRASLAKAREQGTPPRRRNIDSRRSPIPQNAERYYSYFAHSNRYGDLDTD